MNETGKHLGFLRELTWSHVLAVLTVLIICTILVLAMRWIVRRTAESAPSRYRLLILRTAPIARLLIWITGLAIIVPLLVEPTFENVVALAASFGLALAFAIKDYVSCLIAGIVTIVENTYQPGDLVLWNPREHAHSFRTTKLAPKLLGLYMVQHQTRNEIHCISPAPQYVTRVPCITTQSIHRNTFRCQTYRHP